MKWLKMVMDNRQEKKVKHLMKDIIAIVFFASIANADDWIGMYYFAVKNEKYLRKYLELPNGIPSHDTIQRVFAMVSPEYLQEFRKRWNEVMSGSMGGKIKKILAIDGKTQRGNATAKQKANHIVSAVDDNGYCLAEVLVEEKSNEIKAVPLLLEALNIKGHIITADAMSCQTNIAKIIINRRADYILALKGNQGMLFEDVKLYFADNEHLINSAYTKTVGKEQSAIVRREYWQTDNVSWLPKLKDWKGLKSLIMTKNTIIKDAKTTTEVRYFISSLPLCVEDIARAVRKHWMVESYHWHLDVTFREDANHTIDKDSAFNLNIMKKLALNILKTIDVGIKNISLKYKRYVICMDFEKYLDILITS